MARRASWPGPRQLTVADTGDLDWFPEKAVFKEYRLSSACDHAHDLAQFDVYYRDDVHGLRWPVVDGKETQWRFNGEHDPYVQASGDSSFTAPP